MINSMRKPGRRIGLVVGLVAVSAGLLASSASAAPLPILATNSSDFEAEIYTMPQGTKAAFHNAEVGVSHNVTSNGRIGAGRLFLSPTFPGDATRTVRGTQYLTTNDYVFFCSVHPTMRSVLRVTGAGEPVPRPAFRLAILTRRLERAQNTGRVRVKIRALTKSENVTLRLRFRKRQLGIKRDIDLRAGQVRRPFIQLTRAGMNRIAGREQAKLKLVGTVPFGKTRAVKKLLR
jgi:hypothetical protein